MKTSSAIVSNDLKALSKKLRREFDIVANDIHSPQRFQWDWWHLPGRYTHLRTPAATFFTDELHEELATALIAYGRKHLGCQNISPMWLSNYVEGCEQRLHADRPHGPWAFVLSLAPEKRNFQGGETMILRPEILSLWNQTTVAGKSFEEEDIVERIPAAFGRLIVFDPRLPHGVSRVSGTMDARQGRLVVHGWFTQPQPFVEGPLSTKAANQSLLAFDEVMGSELQDGVQSTGTLAYRMEIDRKGTTRKVTTLASSLTSANVEQTNREKRRLLAVVKKHFIGWKFPGAKKPSSLTLSLSIGN